MGLHEPDYATEQKILDAMSGAERKAWEALAGYKFWMFGYHAGRWINYNNLLARRRPNPFRESVHLARRKLDESEQLFEVVAKEAGDGNG